MTIKRIDVGDRMSQAVIHGNTVYLAGQVALAAPGESAEAQTRDILKRIDELLARISEISGSPIAGRVAAVSSARVRVNLVKVIGVESRSRRYSIMIGYKMQSALWRTW